MFIPVFWTLLYIFVSMIINLRLIIIVVCCAICGDLVFRDICSCKFDLATSEKCAAIPKYEIRVAMIHDQTLFFIRYTFKVCNCIYLLIAKQDSIINSCLVGKMKTRINQHFFFFQIGHHFPLIIWFKLDLETIQGDELRLHLPNVKIYIYMEVFGLRYVGQENPKLL